jgi:hypothetical protein
MDAGNPVQVRETLTPMPPTRNVLQFAWPRATFDGKWNEKNGNFSGHTPNYVTFPVLQTSIEWTESHSASILFPHS